jgi:arylsulfatase A-like enzyme
MMVKQKYFRMIIQFMMRITSNKLVLLSLSLELFVCSNAAGQKPVRPTTKNPNIIFILADDMGYGDLGCYNPESKIPTPNMDKLASEGIKFLDAHSPAALCTPSRYGLLTGRYCWRTRLKKGVILGYDETPLIENSRTTIAKILREKGYGTACIGKWHLGMNWQTKNGYQIQNDSDKWVDNPILTENETNIDFSKPVSGGPVELGFDYFFGSLGCTTSDPPYCFIENNHIPVIPSEQSPSKYLGLPGFVPGAWSKGFSLENVDVEFTNKAISYIESRIETKPKDPFFVYLALSSPHNPFLPPDFTSRKSAEGPRGDLVMVVDWSVGKIMECLKKQGIEENTLLIVTSDNGAVKGANGHLSEWKFRGYKSNIWEGGHRVPFIARWPGKIIPGTSSDEVISLTDMFASFSSLVSHPVTGFEGEDSFNVLPAILGEKLKDNKNAARIFHSGGGIFAVRKGDWILIQGTSGAGASVGTGAGNPGINPDSLRMSGQLYNLALDPYQKINLWESKTSIRDSLATLLEKVKSHLGSNLKYLKSY